MSRTAVDQCQCQGNEVPGPNGTFWCKSHQCRKTQRWHELCRKRPEFREAWNDGTGPGQVRPEHGSEPGPEPGWGDRVAMWLTKHGITEERYKEIKETFGLPPTCDCCARQEWLNRVGDWWKRQVGEQ